MDFTIFEHEIDVLTPTLIAAQKLLTEIPAIAPESGGDGESKKAAALLAFLKELGFSNFEQYPAPDSRVSSGERPNFSVFLEGEQQERTIWVMSHLDVVPEGERANWKTEPFTLTQKGDKLFGRGTEDNQQGLVSSLGAAYAFLRLNKKPKYNVRLLFVADEEVGSKYGIAYLLKHHRLFSKNDFILVPDAGDREGRTVEIAEKTGLTVKVHTIGKQTHASMPDAGANAFLAASDLAVRLYNLQNVFNKKDELFSPAYSTFAPTKKRANVPNTNTIPGDDVFYMDCRILPSYTTKDVFAKMRECADSVEKQYGVTVELEAALSDPSPAVAPDAPVVQSLKAAIKAVKHIEAETIGIGGGTVAAHLRKAGFDAVVWGTLDDCAHQSNEYCSVKNMVSDAKVFAYLFANG